MQTARTMFLAVGIGIAALSAFLFGAPAKAQSDPNTVVSVTNSYGLDTSSDIVAFLAPGQTANEFSLTLTFDPSVVSFGRLDPDASWTGELAGVDPGRLMITGKRSTPCDPGATCALATVVWTPVAAGTSAISVASVTLSQDGIDVGLVRSVGSELRVAGAGNGGPAAPDAPASGVVGAAAPAQSPAPVAPASESSDTRSLVLAAVVICTLAVILTLGAVLVISVGRRTWRWSAPAGRAKTPGTVFVESHLFGMRSETLDEAVAEYFAHVEAAGQSIDGAGAQALIGSSWDEEPSVAFLTRDVNDVVLEKATRLKPQRS